MKEPCVECIERGILEWVKNREWMMDEAPPTKEEMKIAVEMVAHGIEYHAHHHPSHDLGFSKHAVITLNVTSSRTPSELLDMVVDLFQEVLNKMKEEEER